MGLDLVCPDSAGFLLSPSNVKESSRGRKPPLPAAYMLSSWPSLLHSVSMGIFPISHEVTFYLLPSLSTVLLFSSSHTKL